MISHRFLKDLEGFFCEAEKWRFSSGGTAFDDVRQRSAAFDDVWSNGEGPEGPVGGEHLERLFDSKLFRKTLDKKSTRPSSPVNRGRAHLGRLRRVTARPLISYYIGVAEMQRFRRFWKDFGGLEAEIFDFRMVKERFWKV